MVLHNEGNWVEVNGILRLVPDNSLEWDECEDESEPPNESQKDDYADLEYFEL